MAVVKFSKQTIEPNPLEVDYWVDITSDPYGSVWKYYNGVDWVSLNLNNGSNDDGLSSFDYYTKEQINSLLSSKADVDSVESKVDDAEFANVIQNIEFREIGDNQMEMVLLKYDNATVGVTIPMASETNPGMLSGESFRDFVKQSQLQSLYDELYQIMSDLNLAEKERNDAEQLRNTSENERIAAETNRFNAENTRQFEEANRVTNENNRITAENNRTTAEQLRIQAEGNRASTFNTLKGQMQTTIQEGQTAVAATEKATSDAQKVVDNYNTKVAEQDDKLSELSSKLYSEESVIIGTIQETGSFFNFYDFKKGSRYSITINSGTVGSGGWTTCISKSSKNINEKQTIEYGVPFIADDDYGYFYQNNISERPFTINVIKYNDRLEELEDKSTLHQESINNLNNRTDIVEKSSIAEESDQEFTTISESSAFFTTDFRKDHVYIVTIARGNKNGNTTVLTKSNKNINEKQVIEYGVPFVADDDYGYFYQNAIVERPFYIHVKEYIPSSIKSFEATKDLRNAFENKLGFTPISSYNFLDIASEWTNGAIQPSGSIGGAGDTRTSPFLAVSAGYITLPSIEFEHDGVVYTLRYRIVGMTDKNNSNSKMIQDRSKTDLIVPIDGYKYVRVSAFIYKEGALVDVSQGISIFQSIVVPFEIKLSVDVYEGVDLSDLNYLVSKSIVNLNSPNETLEKFKQLSQEFRDKSGTKTGVKPFSLLHFSDIHSSEPNLKNIMDYYNHYKTYITDIIHTGDIVGGHWGNDFTFWEKCGAQSVLNCIGNHDVAHKGDDGVYDWLAHIGADSYNRYFKPYIDNWGVVHDGDESHCYYYKDYSVSNIRLIVLDCMSIQVGDDTQLEWFRTTLSTAKDNGLHVVCVYHYPTINTLIPCSMSSTRDMELPTGVPSSVKSIVDDFIETGGNFVCWLTGHSHLDMFGTIDFNGRKQPLVSVDTACASQGIFSDVFRLDGDRSYDLFNIFSVDTYRKRFSIFRVGAQFDCVMKHIGTITYDYANNKLLANY